MFDLGEALKGVSNLDTGREQIQYIHIGMLEEDPNNFYALRDLEQLAANISLCGLQQPIRVRVSQENPLRYVIVSGHRRRAALQLLAKEDAVKWSEVPCIVERDTISPALQQLRLIYANANTRQRSSAEISEEAVQVEKLLYQLKEEGYEFPGRMRDHVAKAVDVSRSKLARLKVIREKLTQDWMLEFKKGTLNESVSYELAQLPPEWQDLIWGFYKNKVGKLDAAKVSHLEDAFKRISNMKCGKRPDASGQAGKCEHAARMMFKCVRDDNWWDNCKKCCLDCSDLKSCKYSCKDAETKKQGIKNAEAEAKQKSADEAEARRAEGIAYIRESYSRFAQARKASGLSLQEFFKRRDGLIDATSSIQRFENRESGFDIKEYTDLPFGFNVRDYHIKTLVQTADVLGCSLDFLLGREALYPSVSCADSSTERGASGGWRRDKPEEPGEYVVMTRHVEGGDLFADTRKWDGCDWIYPSYDQDPVVCWLPMPKEDCDD